MTKSKILKDPRTLTVMDSIFKVSKNPISQKTVDLNLGEANYFAVETFEIKGVFMEKEGYVTVSPKNHSTDLDIPIANSNLPTLDTVFTSKLAATRFAAELTEKAFKHSESQLKELQKVVDSLSTHVEENAKLIAKLETEKDE